MAILTGQDYLALLEAPPHIVEALTTTWNTMQHEDEQRRKARRNG